MVVVPVSGLLVLAAIARHWRVASSGRPSSPAPGSRRLPVHLLLPDRWYVAQAFELTAVLELIDAPITILTSWILPGAFLIGVLRARSSRAALPVP